MPKSRLALAAAVMTCHLGYTLQQAAFAFLYLVAPIGLAARHCAPLDLLGVSAACSIAAGIYHAGLAVVCESPWASETVHGYWDVDSFARLRMACVARIIVSLTWSVSPCIIHGKGAFKAVRITALIGLVTANVCTVYWAWNTIGSVEHIIPKCLATFFMAGLLSWVSLLTEASSNAMMQRSTVLLAGLQVTAAILRKVYSLDLNGRVTPYTAEDAAHPHWSAPLFFGLLDLAFFIAPTAADDVAKSQTQLRPAAPLPTLTLQRLQALPMKHILIIMLSFIVAWVAVVLPMVSSSITIHSRELLSTDSSILKFMDSLPVDLWWLAQCGGCLLLLVVVVVTAHKKRAREDVSGGTSDHASSAMPSLFPQFRRHVSPRPAYISHCAWLHQVLMQSASSCPSGDSTHAEPSFAHAPEISSAALDLQSTASTVCHSRMESCSAHSSDGERSTPSTTATSVCTGSPSVMSAYEFCDESSQHLVHTDPSTYRTELDDALLENNTGACDVRSQAPDNVQGEALGMAPVLTPGSGCILPAPLLPHSSSSTDFHSFEFVVHENFTKRCGSRAHCKIGKQLKVLATDASFIIDGKLTSGLEEGAAMTVDIFCAVFQQERNGVIEVFDSEPSQDSASMRELKKLGTATLDASTQGFRLNVPAQQLVSTRSAVVSTKRALAAEGDLRRLRLATDDPDSGFRTCIRAEVTEFAAEKTQSFHFYSTEVYVCGRAYLRKLCNPERCRNEQQIPDS